MNRRRAVLLPLDEVREVAGEMAEQMDEAAQTIDWYRQVMAEAEVQKPKYGEAARMLEPIFAEANEKVFQTQRYIIQQTRKGAEHSETSAAYKAAFQFLLEHAVPEIAAMAEEIVKTMTKVYHVAPSYSVTKRDAPAKTEGIVGSVVDILKRLFSGLAEKLSPHVDKLGDTLAEFKRMLKEPAPEDARVTVGDMAAFLTEVRRQEHPVNRRKLQEIDDGTTGVMLELGPPRTSGNPRAAWEAGVRHQGWAKDSAYFDTREEATQWLDSYDLNSVASSSYGPGKKFARGLARGLARKESVRKANESVENVVVEVPTVKLVSKLVGRYVPRDFSLWTDDAVSFQHADGVGEIDGLAALERLLDELTGTPTGLEEYSINGSSTSLTFDPDVVAEYQQASGYWAMDADAEYAASELEADPDLAVSLLRSWCREAGVHLDIDDFLTPNEEVDSEEDGEVEEARKRPKRSR